MKAVVLFGSPRKDGNTHALVDAFAGVLLEKQHEVKVLYLNDLNIRPCQGCLSCIEKGECRIDDDMRR
jgi:multimeric flavodoxin WrbA